MGKGMCEQRDRVVCAFQGVWDVGWGTKIVDARRDDGFVAIWGGCFVRLCWLSGGLDYGM